MPTKKVTTCPKGKPVLVTVYVEKPKRSAFSSNRPHTHPHHHNPHIRHTITREVIHYRRGAGGEGYISRRAELLQYSQRLRQSSRSAAPTTTLFSTKPDRTNSPHPPAKIVTAQRKPITKKGKDPSCFGNCSIPSIFEIFSSSQDKKSKKTKKKHSGTTSSKIKSAIKSLKVQKKQGFFSKLFTASSRRK